MINPVPQEGIWILVPQDEASVLLFPPASNGTTVVAGPTGATGAIGPTGPTGPQGPAGADGADGDAADIAAEIHAATADTLADADEWGFWQATSGLLRKITWTNLKVAIKTYADTLYAAITHSHTLSGISQSGATTNQVATWNGSAWVPATPSGASPGGSGSEMQYRGGASTFSAASGTHWDAVNGRLSIGAGTSPAGVLHVACDSASEIVGIDQAAVSQTANIREWRNSAGTLLAAITKNGNLQIGSGFINSGGSQLIIADTDGGSTSGDLTVATLRASRYRDDTYQMALASIGGITGLVHQAANAVAWSSDSTWYGTIDLQLVRAAANILGIRNGSTGGAAIDMQEMTAPSAPSANGVRLYAEDNGSGKTRLMALFPTGAAQQIAIEP